MLKDADERTIQDVARARLALALVSARAHQCPNKSCGRRRLCLARFGQPGTNVHTKMGDCRNMSAAEWQIVSLGIFRNMELLRQHLQRRDAARWAEVEALPKAERERRLAEARARDAVERPSRGTYFWRWLWMEADGDRLVSPRDILRVNATMIDYMAKRGIHSALEAEEG